MITAATGLAGLLLGFFGLPAVVNSPTASRPTVTITEEVPGPTVTVTAPAATSGSPTSSGSEAPGTSRQQLLAQMQPVDELVGLERAQSYMKGKEYPNSLAAAVCTPNTRPYSYITFNLGSSWKRLTATIGLDDNSTGSWSMTIDVLGDGRPLQTVQADLADPKPLVVDVSGVTRLEVQYRPTGYCDRYKDPGSTVAGRS
ncbi:NPCBM/NEW2 domain-containing protein [Kitasatospora hibisci]|uniref:NPCBM/NEW2 domain-containing protein n=1 Tax=Kitasatospora hibisci TaxID=3369522 RepID=UPI003754F5D3